MGREWMHLVNEWRSLKCRDTWKQPWWQMALGLFFSFIFSAGFGLLKDQQLILTLLFKSAEAYQHVLESCCPVMTFLKDKGPTATRVYWPSSFWGLGLCDRLGLWLQIFFYISNISKCLCVKDSRNDTLAQNSYSNSVEVLYKMAITG